MPPELAWIKDITIAAERIVRFTQGYDEIGWEIVWQVATRDIPQLLEDLQPLLPGEYA